MIGKVEYRFFQALEAVEWKFLWELQLVLQYFNGSTVWYVKVMSLIAE